MVLPNRWSQVAKTTPEIISQGPFQGIAVLPRSAPTVVGDRGEDPAINRCRQTLSQIARRGYLGSLVVFECSVVLLVAVKTAVAAAWRAYCGDQVKDLLIPVPTQLPSQWPSTTNLGTEPSVLLDGPRDPGHGGIHPTAPPSLGWRSHRWRCCVGRGQGRRYQRRGFVAGAGGVGIGCATSVMSGGARMPSGVASGGCWGSRPCGVISSLGCSVGLAIRVWLLCWVECLGIWLRFAGMFAGAWGGCLDRP
jgi:hypothetical protein